MSKKEASAKKNNYTDMENTFNILRGAENNDFVEVDSAIAENPHSINFQHELSGLTALHIASGDGNYSMSKHLLSQKFIDVTIRDWMGRDALDLATAIGHKGIIEEISKIMYPKSFGLQEP